MYYKGLVLDLLCLLVLCFVALAYDTEQGGGTGDPPKKKVLASLFAVVAFLHVFGVPDAQQEVP